MEKIRLTVATEFEQVNQLIVEQLHSNVPMVENVGHYIVDAGGKRLRPLLVLLTASALGGCEAAHIKFAAIIEFIHTATLLHDDVVDISSLRRGRPTANAEFGNAPSVLVGDFLYTRAFQLMVQLADMDILDHMADTTNTIAEGEVLQLTRAGQAGDQRGPVPGRYHPQNRHPVRRRLLWRRHPGWCRRRTPGRPCASLASTWASPSR